MYTIYVIQPFHPLIESKRSYKILVKAFFFFKFSDENIKVFERLLSTQHSNHQLKFLQNQIDTVNECCLYWLGQIGRLSYNTIRHCIPQKTYYLISLTTWMKSIFREFNPTVASVLLFLQIDFFLFFLAFIKTDVLMVRYSYFFFLYIHSYIFRNKTII